MKSKHKLTEEEKALLQSAMKGVTPLGSLPVADSTPKLSLPVKENIPKSTSIRHKLSNYYTETVAAETILAYSKPDFPNKGFQNLKRGNIAFGATLDLHGLTIEQAQDALCEFLFNAQQQQIRCVLVIHGKGRQANTPPLLKNHIFHWLKQIPEVLAVHSALPKHGGAGAVYIYLKKNTIFFGSV